MRVIDVQNHKQKHTYEVTIGQICLAIIIAAIFLTVVFEVGVWIGKQRGIKAKLEADRRTGMPGQPTRKVSTEAKLPGLTSPDTHPKQQEPVEAAKPKPAGQDNAQPTTPQDVTAEAKPPHEPQQAQSREELAAAEAGKYTVQVGAFSSRENAEKLVALLESYEYESWSKPKLVAGKILHFVFIGRFETEQEGEQLGRSMQGKLSYITDYKVRKIQD